MLVLLVQVTLLSLSKHVSTINFHPSKPVGASSVCSSKPIFNSSVCASKPICGINVCTSKTISEHVSVSDVCPIRTISSVDGKLYEWTL